jgi:hypothetical protein
LDEYLGAIGVSNIDKKRITAVRKLEELGYTFANNDWMHRDNDVARAPAITDALHAPLLERAHELEGCTEGSDAEREFANITDAIKAYKAVLPLGRTKDGKG